MGRLVQIEVTDFKSYHGKHIIGPFKQFTAVIGPNGAGKSNVMDAISFVLGVNAKTLRGGDLKDLIFRVEGAPPTRRRAIVRLIYEVDDGEVEGMDKGDHLTFSRAISPSGVATYRVNERETTREQYDEALKGINILVKAKNFLVFQGDVEAIASKNPKQLLAMFEHVSGSEELARAYDEAKEAKEQAEEATIFAFQKKKGVAAERREAKEQKEEAERFDAALARQSAVKRDFFLWELFHLERRIHDAADQVREVGDAVKEAQDYEEEVAEELKEHAKKAAASKKRRDKAESRKATLSKAAQKALTAAIKARTAKSQSETKVSDAEKTLQKVEGLAADKAEEVKSLEASIAETEGEIAALEGDEDGADGGEGGLTLGAAQRREFLKKKQEVAAKTAKQQAKLDGLKRDLATANDELNALRSECDELSSAREEMEAELAGLVEHQAKVQAGIEAGKKSMEEESAELEKLNKSVEADRARQEAVISELEEVRAKLRDAKDEKRLGEHELKMEEAVEAMKRHFPHVRGRLSDLCKPSSRKYNLAVTRALGKNMDAVVVDTEAQGFQCIKYLRDNHIGVCEFLPLDRLRVKEIDERLRALGPAYHLAVDVVTYDPSVATAVQFACGSAVVCEDLDAARDLRFRRKTRVKCVTLGGAVITKAGLMTGGSTSEDLGRANRWDEKELEAERARRDELTAESDALRVALARRGMAGNRMERINDLETTIATSRNKLKVLQGDLTLRKRKAAALKGRLEKVVQSLAEKKPAIQRLESQVAQLAASVEKLETAVHKTEDAAFAAFSKKVGVDNIREYEEQHQAREERRIAQRSSLTATLAKLKAKLAFEMRTNLDESVTRAKKKVEAEKTKLAQLTKSASAAESKHAEAQALVSEATTEVGIATSEYEAIIAESKAIRHRKTEAAKKRAALVSQQTTKETSLEKLRVKRHEMLTKAQMEEVGLPMLDGDEESDAEAAGSSDDEADSASRSRRSSRGKKSGLTGVSLSQTSTRVKRDARVTSRIDFTSIETDSTVKGEQRRDPERLEETRAEFEEELHNLADVIERMQPNMKAAERFHEVQGRVTAANDELDGAKAASKAAAATFSQIKSERLQRFMDAFEAVSECIDRIYKDLTRSSKHALGGTASLHLDNPDDPFAGGIKFTAMPPMKRFRDMEQLSGGEKTVAALALLFAIHSYQPSPFFVLDEIEASLDNVNINKVSNYIRRRAHDPVSPVQCVVISLKDNFYDKADALVGIYRERQAHHSATLTLDLSGYADASSRRRSDAGARAVGGAGDSSGYVSPAKSRGSPGKGSVRLPSSPMSGLRSELSGAPTGASPPPPPSRKSSGRGSAKRARVSRGSA